MRILTRSCDLAVLAIYRCRYYDRFYQSPDISFRIADFAYIFPNLFKGTAHFKKDLINYGFNRNSH